MHKDVPYKALWDSLQRLTDIDRSWEHVLPYLQMEQKFYYCFSKMTFIGCSFKYRKGCWIWQTVIAWISDFLSASSCFTKCLQRLKFRLYPREIFLWWIVQATWRMLLQRSEFLIQSNACYVIQGFHMYSFNNIVPFKQLHPLRISPPSQSKDCLIFKVILISPF